MKEIVFDENKMIEIHNHTSKGNQPKWCENGVWYKADHMGYEGLIEVLVSRLLEKTNAKNFVIYKSIKIIFGNKTRNGCYSYNFLVDNEELIPLEKLHRFIYGVGLSEKLRTISDVSKKIKYTVDFVEKNSKIPKFGEYLTLLLEIDALFLNEDRHTNNIALIRNASNGSFRLSPIFDNGLSLLSDLDAYWLDGNLEKHIKRVNAKPFSSFAKQVEASEKMYGKQLEVCFDTDDINTILKDFEGIYDESIIKRVKKVLEYQMIKYGYCK